MSLSKRTQYIHLSTHHRKGMSLLLRLGSVSLYKIFYTTVIVPSKDDKLGVWEGDKRDISHPVSWSTEFTSNS